MSLDIVEGDILVYGGKEYPIRAIGAWEWDGPATVSMQRMMRRTCATKRLPAMSGGKRGAATTNLSNVACTPLDPATIDLTADVMKRDARLAALLATESLLETTIDDGGRYLRVLVEAVK